MASQKVASKVAQKVALYWSEKWPESIELPPRSQPDQVSIKPACVGGRVEAVVGRGGAGVAAGAARRRPRRTAAAVAAVAAAVDVAQERARARQGHLWLISTGNSHPIPENHLTSIDLYRSYSVMDLFYGHHTGPPSLVHHFTFLSFGENVNATQTKELHNSVMPPAGSAGFRTTVSRSRASATVGQMLW